MTDRDALAAALDKWQVYRPDDGQYELVLAAARERLAQLPRTCDTCNGDKQIYAGGTHAEWGPCPTCHGSGKVYPAELVERIARVIEDCEGWELPAAVAVLDAINKETL